MNKGAICMASIKRKAEIKIYFGKYALVFLDQPVLRNLLSTPVISFFFCVCWLCPMFVIDFTSYLNFKTDCISLTEISFFFIVVYSF